MNEAEKRIKTIDNIVYIIGCVVTLGTWYFIRVVITKAIVKAGTRKRQKKYEYEVELEDLEKLSPK